MIISGSRRPVAGPGALLLAALLGGCGTSPADPGPEPPPVEEGHAFVYDPPSGAPAVTAISVRGSFNGWAEKAMARSEDGSWRAVVDLPDGTHQYKFYINGGWVSDMCHDATWGDPARGYTVDPAAEGCVPDGFEGQNAFITLGAVPLDLLHHPAEPAQLSGAGGRLSVRFRARTGQAAGASVVYGTDTVPMHLQATTGLHDTWRASIPAATASYALLVQHGDAVVSFGPYTAPANLFRSVAWAESAIGYQVFPERFGNGDPSNDALALETDEIHYRDPALGGTEPVLSPWDGPVLESHCCHQYFGGDLQGVVDRLDHLEALGVTVLYFNPLFLAGSAHGYDTFDYLQVAPNFGDSALLAGFVETARARGIRLIWDFVPNHVGIGHWAFRDAVEKGEASDYWDWFSFHVAADQVQPGNGEHYDAWWGFGSLPELKTRNPEVRAHLMDVVRHWTAFGFDGIRVDVPGDIDNRAEFFGEFRRVAKEANPEVYLVGEIWERDAGWLRGDEFDALMNYAVGHGVVRRFAAGDIAAGLAARELATLYTEYPEAAAAMLFNVVATHDTDRLLTMMGGGELGAAPSATALARQRLAAALLFALPGMPVTFQGDECAFLGGAAGRHTARYPLQWQSCDPAMTAHYAALAGLRSDLDALRSPALRLPQGTGALLAFRRGEPGPGEVLALFNNGSAPAAASPPQGAWNDAGTGEMVGGTVTVEGFGWRYLVRQ